MRTDRAIVIAHRGASGERPEHTIAAYRLAIEQGADFIEPDLVPTRDGVLVARHESRIDETTDVAQHPEFAARRTTRTIDGVTATGWFTEDFTLAELKTLRARERLPQLRPGNTRFDRQFEIPTLGEIIALAREHGVGIYPETKHPSYFASIGLPLERRLVDELAAAGWRDASAPVFIQSFEVANLRTLDAMTDIRLVQLVASEGGPADGAVASYAAMLDADGLAAIATYADAVGPQKDLVERDGADTGLIGRAHVAGLVVHPWTYRAENAFTPTGDRTSDDPQAHGRLDVELRRILAYGADGFFTDFPLVGAHARDAAAADAPAR